MDEPWAWWRSLGSPATVCAPMVDQSERAFRLLVRRHGCDLCYTPMLHADLVVRDAAYRRDHVPDAACAEDRPLIAQLGGGDPATLAAAAREIAARGGCDAIDVNLGCPQACARRGGYGAFLDEVVASTGALAARWQSVGFVHGVLNTDNCSVHGLTIDYGPFAFLEAVAAVDMFKNDTALQCSRCVGSTRARR